jgi:hypothetical protein
MEVDSAVMDQGMEADLEDTMEVTETMEATEDTTQTFGLEDTSVQFTNYI